MMLYLLIVKQILFIVFYIIQSISFGQADTSYFIFVEI